MNLTCVLHSMPGARIVSIWSIIGPARVSTFVGLSPLLSARALSGFALPVSAGSPTPYVSDVTNRAHVSRRQVACDGSIVGRFDPG